MAIRYNDKEIQVSASLQKVNVDVVYARPEDVIKFDFDIKKVKVTFVNGDVDFIFPNGSVISLASYVTLAFNNNAPKIYDNEGKLISLESLLANVEVTKPEDTILILANRDKSQLVQNDEYINKVIMATVNTGELQGGNPIAGVGDVSIPTSGMASPVIDKTGTVAIFNQKRGLGDFLLNNYTTHRRGTSDSENILPGNTNLVPQPGLTYNFLFGDTGILGDSTTINNNKADYYAVKFGTGDVKDATSQLSPINMNNLGGSFQNKIFNAHSIDGKIKRVLKLDYSGGIFPQSIAISGIPGDKDSSGNMLFRLWLKTGGTTKIVYTAGDNKYMLTQLDPTGKLELFFEFNDTVMDQNLNIKFSLVYFDPKTSEAKLMETYYDVGIRAVSQQSDLSLNSVVINKGASGLVVDADNSGSGDKIFIGGNVANSFASKSGNNLIFTGGGNDTIDVSGPESKSLIYGSTGYNLITGSGSGNDWLIFSNDKSYNKDFLSSPVIQDNYYNTLKAGTYLQFYFGVARDDVIDLWDQIGIGASAGFLKGKHTSNFVQSFASLTVIGDRNGGLSINNIVGSLESDIFNLYFNGVKQKVNIFGGNEKTVVGSRIVLNAQEDDTVTIVFGVEDKSSVTSLKSSETAYIFDTKSFDRIISNGKENLEIKIVYDGKGGYRSSPVYFTAGSNLKEGNKALVDFSGLSFSSDDGHIEFDADSKYNSVNYKGIIGKKFDFFYNFNYIIGSTGNDIFYGNSNSKGYHFNGFNGENLLSYRKSTGGVTFNAFDCSVYKINTANISKVEDYVKFKDRSDSFEKISTIELSNMDNVVVACNAYNIGKDSNNLELILGSGNSILRYDLDKDISSITVEADDLSVLKNSGGGEYSSGKDVYVKKQDRSGYIKYIGTSGDDVFFGGVKYISVFVGTGGNNTLTYEKVTSDINLSFDLLRGIASIAGKQDTYEGISSIIGGAGNDTFSVGNFDPTNVEHVKKVTGIKIDGGGGVNSFKFSSTIITNLDNTKYVLTFCVDSGKVSFTSKDGKPIEIDIDITKGISSIVGTVGNDKFIASKDREFSFDGGSYRVSEELQKNGVYGNSLEYSDFDSSLTINLVNKVVVKGSKQDSFKNIQSFVSGTADDTFILNHTMDDKIRCFDGNSGKNTLTYENTFKVMNFDFTKGKITFADLDTNKIYDIFKNFNIFKGGKGSDVFVLSYNGISYNDKADKSAISIDGFHGNNALDFSNWEVALGTEEKGFVLSKTGTISNNKEDDSLVKYDWQNINSFIGTRFADYFIISDNETNFFLDGNKSTYNDLNNVLDYSKLTKSVVLNVSTGVASKNDGLSSDTIKNIQHILLTDKNDTIRFSNTDKGFLTSLQVVDGRSGDNTIDFKQSTSDISAEIDEKGFKLSSTSTNISFINFNIINSSKGNSIFKATDNSHGSRVFLNGNIGVLKDKYSVLDLTTLSGNVVYNATNLVDNPSDASKLGVLTWGDNKKANIVTRNINKILLNDNDNTIYASANNHTYYVGGKGNNVIDYSNIDDSIFVYINSQMQIVKFVNSGGEDRLSNFKTFKGTKNDDTFIINDLDNVASGIEFDGFKGNNTFSFVGATSGVQIDISLPSIQVKDKVITLKNVQNLVLSKHDDTVKISETNVLFHNIDGSGGNNTIDIVNGGKVVYNKDGRFDLSLNNIPNKIMYFSNFQNIQTTTTTGNVFYGGYGNSMSFNVIGSKNSDVNILTYINAASLVEIDFTTNSAIKGTNTDKFSGINYFFSSQHSSTFYLAKESKDNFETLYINNVPKTLDYDVSTNFNNGIISLLKLGGDIKFYVAGKTFEGAKVKYVWDNISTINFTNNQTIYASFDEVYKYIWRKTDKDTEGVNLVFDTKQSKNGTEYKNGYIVADISSHMVSTFDASGNNKTKVEFNIINNLIGTGNAKDIFYAGLDNINFQGGVDSGKGTLSYKKYSTQDGIVVTFASDNSAVITDLSNSKKKDTAKFISRFEGTSGNDSFVIAENKGQEVIELDGASGVYNKVDFSQLTSGDKGIELDTTKGIPKGNYNYIFKNISTFRLTKNNDTVLGSIGNRGFSKNDNEPTSIIIDGGGGENTLDYSVYVKGTASQINKMNIDLQMGLISKVGYENNKSITTNDSIAVVENNQSKINFKYIVLSGEYTTNTLIVSGGNNNKADTYINVAIKNPTKGLKQAISLENVNESLKFTWNGTAVVGVIGGVNVVYDGFNNIRLSNSDSTLIIDKPTNLIESGGALHGGKGNNTLEIKNNEANSSVVIDVNLQRVMLNVDGSKSYNYSLFNFQSFNLGYSSNTFIATDIGNFVVNFIKSGAKNSVTYNNLNGSFARLVIDGITGEGAQATLSKLSMSDASVINGVDKLFNVKDITLTNSDDIIDVKNNDNGPEITVDGKKGVNTVSFEKSWEGRVDIDSISGGTINLKGYKLINFSKVILTKGDDNIKLKHDSSIQIDGGGGNNTVDYSGGTFSKNPILINEYEVISTGNVRKIAIKVNKEGKFVDELIRFNSITLASNSNSMYTANFVKQIIGNPSGFNINFNAKDITKVENIMDYSKMAKAVNGIITNIRFENNVNFAEVWRDKASRADSLKDNLIGVTKILGTNLGDVFNIDTNVRNLYINAGNDFKGEINLKYVEEEEGKVFVWDLDSHSIAKGSSAKTAKTFLTFNGFKNLGGVHAEGKQIDNIFLIYNFDINYYIVTNSKASSKSVITADYTNVKISAGISYDITFDENLGGAFSLTSYISGDKTNTIRLGGVTNILGNSFSVNSFKLTIGKSSDNVRTYIIQGRGYTGGALDSIEINQASVSSEVLNFNVLSSNNLSFQNNGYAKFNIIGIPSIKFSGEGTYGIVFGKDLVNVNLLLFADTKSKVNFDFKAITSNQYVLNVDKDNLYLRLSSNNINININKLNKIDLNDKSQGQIILRSGVDLLKEMTFSNFNNINLSEYNSAEFKVIIDKTTLADIGSIKISNVTFLNGVNKPLTINLGTKTFSVLFEINNLNIFKSNITILNNFSSFANKNVVKVKDFASSMVFQARDGDKTIFQAKDSNFKVVTQNTKHLDFSEKKADWNIKLFNSFNYFVGGKVHEYGLSLMLDFNSFTLDLTDFSKRSVNAEGISEGIYIGLDTLKATWRGAKAYTSIVSKSGFYNNTNIILPTSGIDFTITAGWIRGYINAVKKGQVTKGFTIDGSKSLINSVTLDFDKDVGETYDGCTFIYFVTRNTTNYSTSDYTLKTIIDKSNQVIDNINFTVKNLGIIKGSGTINNTYILDKLSPLFLEGDKGAKSINKVIFGNNHQIDFHGSMVDMFISEAFPSNEEANRGVKFHGNLGGFNSVLEGIAVLDFSRVVNYKDFKFFVTTFPRYKKAQVGYDPLLILPEIKDSSIPNVKDIKHTLDLTPIGGSISSYDSMGILINKLSKVKVTKDVDTLKADDYFVAQNVYNIILPSVTKALFVMDDIKHSYILNGSGYGDYSYTRIAYSSSSNYKINTTTGTVVKMGEGKGNSVDYFVNVSKVYFDPTFYTYDEKFFGKVKSKNIIDASSEYKILLSFDNITPSHTSDNKIPSFSVDDINTQLFISIAGISNKGDKTFVSVENIRALNISGDGKNHYKVFFIDNSIYYDQYNTQQTFNTNGYFVIVDTNNNNLIYFTGTNIMKFAKEFENFLDGYGKINKVNSYEEMFKAIKDNNYKVDQLKPEEPKNDIIKDSSSNNSNHAQVIDNKEVEEVEEFDNNYSNENIETLNNDNSTIKYNSNHSNEDKKQDAEWIDIDKMNNREEDNKEESLKDNSYNSLNILNPEDQESYNFNLEFNPMDVLETPNDANIDNLSNDVFDEIANSSSQDEEENSAINNTINELSGVENTTTNNASVLLDNDMINNDPSSQVVDSVNKQNSINGNNHR